MATVPPGVKPIYVSNKTKEKYGLADGVTHKLFKKSEAIDDAQTLGFYSLFHEIKSELTNFPGEEILIVSDSTGKYGENFYFCMNEDVKAAELQKLSGGGGGGVAGEADQGDDTDSKAAEAEAEAKRQAEEDAALEAIVVHEEPRQVRPYASETSEATLEEVKEQTVRRSRPMIKVRIQRRRYAFGAACSFNDRESEAAVAEFRPRKEPTYELKRKELSIGLQACPSALAGRRDASSQTTYFPAMDSILQCDMEQETIVMAASAPLINVLEHKGEQHMEVGVGTDIMDADEMLFVDGRVDHMVLRNAVADAINAASSFDTGNPPDMTGTSLLGGAGGRGMRNSVFAGMGGGPGKQGPATPLDKLVDFLNRALPVCEYALSQNETLNIFRNELTLLSDEDVVVMGNSDAKHIREERQFMDLELTNGKALSAVEWHPKSSTWLAVAAVPRLTMEQRIVESALPRPSHILLYTLAEFSNQLVLEAPSDVTCMHWNPVNPNYLAVGMENGHVCVFDLSEARDILAAHRRSEGANSDDTQGTEAETESTGKSGSKALHLRPKFVSAVEFSGNRHVVGVRWLPLKHHLSSRNTFTDDRDGEVCQFISATSDGSVAVWDLKFKERNRARRRTSVSDAPKDTQILQSTLVPGASAANVPAPPPEIPWQPTYKVNVRFGSGHVKFTSFVLNDALPSDPLVCTTEEGRIVVVDWAPQGEGSGVDAWLRDPSAPADKEDTPSAKPQGGSEESDSAGTAMRIIWIAQEGERSPVALQRHPTMSDVFLVVSDFTFSIWKRGIRSPIFTSSPSAAAFSSGRWSPSRPGVVYLGRTDGVLEVWDVLDSTIKPAVTLTLMSVPITTMEFRQVNGGTGATQKQLLAVGDAKGSLHVLDIPVPLKKGSPNEEALLLSYFDREVTRVHYYNARSVFHDAEKAKADTEAQRQAAAAEAAASKLDTEFQAALAQLADKDPNAAKVFDIAIFQRQKAQHELDVADEKYRALELAIMAELKVTEADITSVHSSAAAKLDVAHVEVLEAAEVTEPKAMAAKRGISGSGAAAAKTLATAKPAAGVKHFPSKLQEGKRPR